MIHDRSRSLRARAQHVNNILLEVIDSIVQMLQRQRQITCELGVVPTRVFNFYLFCQGSQVSGTTIALDVTSSVNRLL